LIWLDGAADARKATVDAARAMALWQEAPASERRLGDEALAHVYRTTAHVHLGELDAAQAAIAPVLDLPAERRISWIAKRTARIADKLDHRRFRGSRDAADLAESLRSAR
jgi:hypothetical protein